MVRGWMGGVDWKQLDNAFYSPGIMVNYRKFIACGYDSIASGHISRPWAESLSITSRNTGMA